MRPKPGRRLREGTGRNFCQHAAMGAWAWRAEGGGEVVDASISPLRVTGLVSGERALHNLRHQVELWRALKVTGS